MKEEILHLTRLFGLKLDPDLGQHFIISPQILRLEVSVADLRPSDIALDIGAGFGYLTELLAENVSKVYAIELDSRVISVFRYRLSQLLASGKIELIEGDALLVPLPKDVTVIVSNPPYGIISELIVRLLTEYFSSERFRCSVMIVQKEFAKRLLARPGSKNWSRISACFRFFADGKIVRTVSKRHFFPAPEVDSALIKFWPTRSDHLIPFAVFEEVTRIIFSSPNRKLRGILKNYLRRRCFSSWKSVLARLSALTDLDRRAREASVEEIEKIGKVLFEENCLL